jgi:peptidoglycan/LPS O-acetylase OafA/YrhL
VVKNKDHHRIFGLDLLRCTAITCVLISHTFPFMSKANSMHVLACYTATLGVEFFFVLSGFLIGTILIKTHNKDSITNFNSIGVFWIRRWFRTLPNYYLMIGVYALLFYIIHHSFNLILYWPYLIFLQNFVSEMKNDYFGVSWSLSIEEWFYFLFPLVLFAIQYIIREKKASLFAAILLFIFIPLLLRAYCALNTSIAFDAGFRKMTPLRLDAIGIGVLAAFFKNYYINIWNKKTILFVFGIILFVPLMIVFYKNFIVSYDGAHEKELVDAGFFLKTMFFTAVNIAIAMLLPLIYSINIRNNFIVNSVNFISTISYSLYLLHPIVLTLVVHFFKNTNNYMMVFLIWAVSIVGAYLQYNFFEKRMTVLRENFGNKKDAVTV